MNLTEHVRTVGLWLIVALSGSVPLGFGLYSLFAPSMRALRLDSRPSYLLILLGFTLIGASVIGIIQRWGPLVPGFVIGLFVGLFVLVPSNMPEEMAIAVLFAIAGIFAIVLNRALRVPHSGDE